METKTTTASWTELIVYKMSYYGHAVGTIPQAIANDPEFIEAITGFDANGNPQFNESGYFLAAPGETPDWGTPRGPVDWDGMEQAVNEAKFTDALVVFVDENTEGYTKIESGGGMRLICDEDENGNVLPDCYVIATPMSAGQHDPSPAPGTRIGIMSYCGEDYTVDRAGI